MHYVPVKEQKVTNLSRATNLSNLTHLQLPPTVAAEIDNILFDKQITSPKKLGQIIRIGRKQKKLTQTELSDLAGVGRRFLSELENGKPSLEFGKVITVANALGIDLFAKQR
jgi:y4mF family transcriptional regulator